MNMEPTNTEQWEKRFLPQGMNMEPTNTEQWEKKVSTSNNEHGTKARMSEHTSQSISGKELLITAAQ